MNRTIIIIIILLFISCGSDNNSSGSGCDYRNVSEFDNVCIFYASGEALDRVKEACTSNGGTLVAKCPKTGALGKCKRLFFDEIINDTYYVTYYFYSEEADSIDQHKSECIGYDGEWTDL